MKIMCNGFVLTPPVPHRDLNMAGITCRLLSIITHLLPNDSEGLKGVSGSILLHAVVKKVKVCFYTAQYPVC